MVVRGPLREGIDDRRAEWLKRRRPRGPLGFQALVALHAAWDVVDGFALFPDQFHAVDAAIARMVLIRYYFDYEAARIWRSRVLETSRHDRSVQRPFQVFGG